MTQYATGRKQAFLLFKNGAKQIISIDKTFHQDIRLTGTHQLHSQSRSLIGRGSLIDTDKIGGSGMKTLGIFYMINIRN